MKSISRSHLYRIGRYAPWVGGAYNYANDLDNVPFIATMGSDSFTPCFPNSTSLLVAPLADVFYAEGRDYRIVFKQ